jgi:hypothetical protein
MSRRSEALSRATGALVVLLLAGAALRLLFMLAWQPAFMGWPDAKSYIDVSQGELFGNVLRPAGYPLLLRGLYAIAPSIQLVVVVNHLLGLASAALLYLAVVRAGAPRLAGLVPAAIVALGGDQMFLEHSPLSETPFTFLVALALYAAVRTRRGVAAGGWRLASWAGVAGIALACAASVRVVGLALLPVFVAWLALSSSGDWRRRAATATVAAGAALCVLGAYSVAEYRAVGEFGMSRNGAYHLYGRVAPFADCSRFTPPRGTEALCEATPRADRPITDAYIFSYWYSPAVRVFNNPFAATPEASSRVGAFAWAALVHQPFDYVKEVGAGMLRYVAPESGWLHGFGGGPGYDALVGRNILFNPVFQRDALDSLGRYYGWHRYEQRRGLLAGLRRWEGATRIQGPLFVLLALLSLAGPLVAARGGRPVAWLFTVVAWTLLVTPVATLEFSARTAVPGFGLLGASAAIGGWRSAQAWQARRGRSGAGAGGPALAPSRPLAS